MKYTIEQIDAMLYALDDAIYEAELRLNIEDDIDSRNVCIEQLNQLDKIFNLLTDLKL
jgi:ferritin-like metal-binding protein YciE